MLLRRSKHAGVNYTIDGETRSIHNCGLNVTLIDFTLSRLELEDGSILFNDLEQDIEIFKGPKGMSQCDTYRAMRKSLKKKWDSSCMETNRQWIQYLVRSVEDLNPSISKNFWSCIGSKFVCHDMSRLTLFSTRRILG